MYLPLSLYTYIYIYVCVCVYIYIYMYKGQVQHEAAQAGDVVLHHVEEDHGDVRQLHRLLRQAARAVQLPGASHQDAGDKQTSLSLYIYIYRERER